MKTRKLLSLMLVVLLFASLTLVFSANLANAQGDTYTVQYGDNLTSIAARFGVSVQALAQANGIANVNNIYAGEVLKLPTANTPTTTPTPSGGQQAYIVQPGDSLTSVAGHFGVGIYDLAALNHLSVMSYLYVGQTLAIPVPTGPSVPAPAATTTTIPTTTTVAPTTTAAPTPTPTPKPTTTQAAVSSSQTSYTVQAGDTLSAIATRFNTTVSAIVTANNIANPSMISVGQVLIIPAAGTGGGTSSPAPTPTIPPASHPIGTGKWIDVNLTTQKMVAYEGSTPVYSSLVSTGVSSHPTVTGTFNIYVKYTSQLMTGGTPGVDYYYLPNVPYVMYFYQSYALHGTYWHHNFGHVMSHGCVNLPTPVAQWVFNWAPVGTPVYIHY